jgi:tellurite methyltransferase
MLSDKIYWDGYYSRYNDELDKPSSFAVFVDKYLKQFIINEYVRTFELKVLDVGCGNGRDTYYFANNGYNVYSIDSSYNATTILKDDINRNDIPNISVFKQDFTNITEPKINLLKYDVIYTRFSLHSVNIDGELRFINWAFNHLTRNGRLCIEVRSDKDPMCGIGEEVVGEKNAWINTHYRRFHNINEFAEILNANGFRIIYFNESNGLSKVGEDNPVVIRIIVRRRIK